MLCIMIFPALCLAGIENISDNNYPFRPGERLAYELFWGLIPVGTAVMQVLPMETIHGTRAYHFAFTAKSTTFVDKLYKVQDFIDAYADAKMSHSLLYRQRQEEGRHKRDIIVTFDWKKAQTQYASSGKKLNPISILPGTFDPLSIFYTLRFQPLRENVVLEVPVTDGKKCVMGKARVLRRQKISIPSGEYDTFLVEPDLKDVGGVFKKSKDARLYVWFTSDEKHIPVKVTSKMAVGNFVAELISIERIHDN
jgi:hypothetical protein